MKRITNKLLLTVCGLLSAVMAFADDGLSIADFTIITDYKTTVPVELTNTDEISGFQFDLVLPTGFSLSDASVNSARTSTYNYTVTTKTQSDGSIRIVCLSTTDVSAVFRGTSGTILNLDLIASGVAKGTYSVSLSKQRITKKDLSELKIASATTTATVIVPGAPTDVQLIDLGLPSGTLWATMNVGANAPEEYGGYFAWGEVYVKSSYTWENYKWANGTKTSITKYCNNADYGIVDNKTSLEPLDDAAYVNWGSDWQIPSQAQAQELLDCCTFQSYTMNEVAGYLVTGINGKSVFFPSAGNDSWGKGQYVRTWLNEINVSGSNCAYGYNIDQIQKNLTRNSGRSVRPVSATQKAIRVTSVSLDNAEVTKLIGESFALIATELPADASDKTITWSSSDESVATVDQNGLVTAIALGSATITAAAADGSGKSATCSVKVNSYDTLDDTDIKAYDNIIFFYSISTNPGVTITLPLMMNNTDDDLVSMAFDLVLPAGITLNKNIRGTAYAITYDVSERGSTSTHSLSATLNEDNSIRISCSSSNTAFYDNSGAVLDLPITVSSDITKAKHKIVLRNVVLTNSSGETYNMAYVISTLDTSCILGDINGDSSVNIADLTSLICYLKGTTPAKFVESAADVNEDDVIDIKDVNALGTIILSK